MSLKVVQLGRSIEDARAGLAPILVCVHGYMGGPDDFRNMLPAWESEFCILEPDFLAEFRTHGIIEITKEGVGQLTYEDSADQMADYLRREFPGRKAYFFGISFGGKILLDFGARHPDLLIGGVITDIGLGSLAGSSLYHFLETTLPSINLNLEWAELKAELLQKIPEKNVRILVQTQLYYPNKVPPAAWRASIETLHSLVTSTRISEQWDVAEKVKSPILILCAEQLSSIAPEVAERMKSYPQIEMRQIPNSTHFIHITHVKHLTDAVLDIRQRTV
jgi:pimeloyl-ACP methyl ester carboxylesterase